jgi:hypothetical protein
MEGVNSTMIYLVYCKRFYKCHNILLPRTTIKKKKEITYLGQQAAGILPHNYSLFVFLGE